jgi:hypothetical protein
MRVIDWWNKTVCFVPDWKVCKICGRYQILAAILSSQYFSGAWALMYHFTIITITKFYQSVQASQSVLKVHRWKCLQNVQGIYHHVHGMRLLCVLDTCAKFILVMHMFMLPVRRITAHIPYCVSPACYKLSNVELGNVYILLIYIRASNIRTLMNIQA